MATAPKELSLDGIRGNGLEVSDHHEGGVWLEVQTSDWAHIDRAEAERLRDWLNEWLGQTIWQPIETAPFDPSKDLFITPPRPSEHWCTTRTDANGNIIVVAWAPGDKPIRWCRLPHPEI